MPRKLRVDKWLWAVRIFKTRTKASKACDEGKVKIEDNRLKPSSSISIGNIIKVRLNYQNRVYKVLDIIEKRAGAPIAEACYEDLTPPEELERINLKSAFNIPTAYRERGAGRPTKRERRDIDKYKDDSDEEE